MSTDYIEALREFGKKTERDEFSYLDDNILASPGFDTELRAAIIESQENAQRKKKEEIAEHVVALYAQNQRSIKADVESIRGYRSAIERLKKNILFREMAMSLAMTETNFGPAIYLQTKYLQCDLTPKDVGFPDHWIKNWDSIAAGVMADRKKMTETKKVSAKKTIR